MDKVSRALTKLTGLFSLLNLFLYSLQSQHYKNPKHSDFFEIICFERSLPHRYLSYQPRFDAARKVLCFIINCTYDEFTQSLTPHAVITGSGVE